MTQDRSFESIRQRRPGEGLIYFTAALQKKLFPSMHYALRAGGTLFLGTAETVGGYADLFEPMKSKWRLYRTLAKPRQRIDLDFPVHQHPHRIHADEPAKATVAAYSFQELADHVLLQRVAPPAVLVNAEGHILYISGCTGPYLEPAAGRANWNIYVRRVATCVRRSQRRYRRCCS